MEFQFSKEAYMFEVQRRKDINDDIARTLQLCFGLLAVLVLGTYKNENLNEFGFIFSYWISIFILSMCVLTNIIGYMAFKFSFPNNPSIDFEYSKKLQEWNSNLADSKFENYLAENFAKKAGTMHQANLLKGRWNFRSKVLLILAFLPLASTFLQMAPVPFFPN